MTLGIISNSNARTLKVCVLFMILFIMGMNTKAVGQVYYVDPNGADSNPGTLTEPWHTIQKAANTLAPGDTVYVRGGVYNEKVTLNVSGSTNDGYITFQNYENEIPILDGTGLTVPDVNNGMFLIVDQHHVIIRGFEIRNYRTSTPNIIPVGIHVRGVTHHIQLRNNHIHHIETNAPVDGDLMGADAHGIAVYGTSAPDSINNILIEGNELHDLILGSSEGLVLNGNVSLFTVSNNIVYNCDNIGIDFIGFEDTAPNSDYDQARNGIVTNNTIYNISSFGNPAYGDSYSAGGIYVDGGKDIVIERNTISQADIGIEIASEHQGRATSFITVRNNFLFNNRMTGIAMGGYDTERGSTENCTIVNNTLYNNDTLEDGNGEILLQFDTRYNIIKNNIFYANNQSILIGDPFTENIGNVVDYNLYFSSAGITYSEWEWKNIIYQGFATYKSATGNDYNSLFVTPEFVNLSEPNLHLLVASSAINAGENLPQIGDYDIDGQTRVQGGIVDIGADEFSETTDIFEAETNMPQTFVLKTNYPNPFNAVTIISYQLPELSFVNLSIYNITGQLVETLVNRKVQPGYHNIIWNSTDVGSGVYFYKIVAGKYSATGKCLLLK
ncbi:MAG: right-handed parallel beta-helix repeat-containing protein [Melioribacteraceae bacterium]|nr:right-handed parallel beta-helix repeat-containing protein [Melioribacteraceae bacterium]